MMQGEAREKRKRNQLLDNAQCVWLEEETISTWRRYFSQEVGEKIKTSCTFAEGKRDDIFSPATSGHVLKLLPTIFLQRTSKEDEAREERSHGC